jgi:Protein of unknown function (DUF1036)
MRSLVSALAFAFVLGLPCMGEAQAQPRPPGPGAPGAPGGPGGPGGGGGVSKTFQLQICNKAAREVGDIYVALASVTPDRQMFRVQGWWKIPANQCVNLGEFQRPGVFGYGMAQGGQFYWSDPEPSLCVNLNAAFDYTFDPDVARQCGDGEETKGFFQIRIDDKNKTKTFTLN